MTRTTHGRMAEAAVEEAEGRETSPGDAEREAMASAPGREAGGSEGRAREDGGRSEPGADPMEPVLGVLLHDLNAPLQTVIGFSELLLPESTEAGDGEPGSRQREFLKRILAAGWEMARLLGAVGVLRDPTAPASEGDRRGTSPETLLERAGREAVRGDSQATGSVRTEVVEGLPAIRGRPDRLVQALGYLVETAGRGTRPDRPVVLRANSSGEGVDLEIRGPGLDAARELEMRLFSGLSRIAEGADARERRRRLELFAARRILEGHGGLVEVDVEPDGAGVLRVTLPAAGGDA